MDKVKVYLDLSEEKTMVALRNALDMALKHGGLNVKPLIDEIERNIKENKKEKEDKSE